MNKSILACSLLAVSLTACTGSKTNPPGDTTAPTVSLSVSSSGTAVKLSAAASDAGGIERVEFYVGGKLHSADNTAPYEAALTAPVGPNTFIAKAFDKAGNAAQDSKTVTISQPPTPPTNTLYQGVWGYAYGDLNSTAPEEEGNVAFVDDEAGKFGKVAVGAYANQAQSKLGIALMGPISEAGALEVFFTKDTSENVQPFLVAADEDGRLDSVAGRNVFLGAGVITDDGGNTLRDVKFVMVQYSTDKPQSVQAQAALQQQANELAAQYLHGYAPAARTAPDLSALNLNAAELLSR